MLHKAFIVQIILFADFKFLNFLCLRSVYTSNSNNHNIALPKKIDRLVQSNQDVHPVF